MNCGSSRTIVQGSDDSLAFQLTVNKAAYDFEDATSCVVRLVTTDMKGTTGTPKSITNTGNNDWRRGYGEVVWTEAETSAMDSGTYRLEISTDQPTVGKKIAIGTSNINVIASP